MSNQSSELPALLTFSQAAKLLPQKTHTSTLWRWATRGYPAKNGERIFLEVEYIGSRKFTSAAHIKQFMAAMRAANEAAPFAVIGGISIPSHKQAVKELRAMGI